MMSKQLENKQTCVTADWISKTAWKDYGSRDLGECEGKTSQSTHSFNRRNLKVFFKIFYYRFHFTVLLIVYMMILKICIDILR